MTPAGQLKQKTITFFGHFGRQNLGNECILQAIIRNAHKYLPDVSINCVCSDPEDTSARYNISAFRMSHRRWAGYNYPVIRLVRRIFIRLPGELIEWIRAFKTLKGTNILVIAGTGVLGGFAIRPFELHYEIFNWSLLAK